MTQLLPHHAAIRGILSHPWKVGHILQGETTVDVLHEMHHQASEGAEAFWLDYTMLVDLREVTFEANRMGYTLYCDFLPHAQLNTVHSPICLPYEQWQDLTSPQRIAELLSIMVAEFREPAFQKNDITIDLTTPYSCVTLPPSMNVFAAAAEARALRLCWQRVTDAADLSPKPLKIVCCGFAGQLAEFNLPKSRSDLAEGDCPPRSEGGKGGVSPLQNNVEDNIIRNTVFALSGIMMQAEAIFLHPHEAGNENAMSLARNTLLMLKHESRLGDVQDIAGGAYVLEAEAMNIARAAWDIFREHEGGA